MSGTPSPNDQAAPADPIAHFTALLSEAQRVDRARLPEPTAMTLATVDDAGRPSARIVLLKEVDARGFVFYTNYESRKGRELLAHPWAALCFHWQPMERQVRVEGPVERVTDAEADAYFASRARMSRVGAWASRQSATLESDAELQHRVRDVEARFAGGDVPRPPNWSGFRVVPQRIEFWRGRPHRLHERFLYERDDTGWRVRRLFP
ncbi:MAG TPA: pyridoxamine 5'-phosphate oxidase [Gemmatimonadaceae bacterium]|nr:pyridoxamine 5'-phosphate oxidase [Gemmatimonadaceae bacterium]